MDERFERLFLLHNCILLRSYLLLETFKHIGINKIFIETVKSFQSFLNLSLCGNFSKCILIWLSLFCFFFFWDTLLNLFGSSQLILKFYLLWIDQIVIFCDFFCEPLFVVQILRRVLFFDSLESDFFVFLFSVNRIFRLFGVERGGQAFSNIAPTFYIWKGSTLNASLDNRNLQGLMVAYESQSCFLE